MRTDTSAMIDIETMGVSPDSAILTVGACAFDLAGDDTFDSITDRFSTTISIESNEQAGRRIDGSTVAWWLKQSSEAQKALFEPPIRNLKTALVELRIWLDGLRPKLQYLWANDPDFDVVILKNAFDQLGERWPISYALNRSVRTIKHLAWPNGGAPNFRAEGVHHRAVDDAVAQALMVQAGYRKLVLGR
jgi:exodeoxyribonuclease VIII